MIVTKLRPHTDKILLAAIFLFLSASTIAWTLADKTPPAWDPADHISTGYDYYRPLAHLDFRGFGESFFSEHRYYAPLVHLVTASLFLLFGASKLMGIGVNIISLAVLLASTAWIARMLYTRNGDAPTDRASKGPTGSGLAVGVVAALLAASYHFPAWLLHDAFIDFPLIAIVTAGFGFLIQAGDFKNRRHALLFGVVAGLGMLTKQTFAFFLFLPAIYVSLRILLSRDRRAIANLFLAAVVTFAISAIYYLPHLQDVLAIYRVNREAAISENEAPLFGFVSNVYYSYGLIALQMQLPLGLLFIGGLIYSLARRRKESMMLYLWLLSGIGTFTLIANKDMRYTVPVLPAAALISVCWLGSLFAGKTATRLRRSAVTVIVAWAFLSFFNAQWPRPGRGYALDFPKFQVMIFDRNYYGFDRHPLPDDWAVPELIRAVAEYKEDDDSLPSDQARALESQTRKRRRPTPEETVSPPTRPTSSGNNPNGPTLGVVVNLVTLNPSSIALYARLLAPERAGPPLINVDWLVVDAARDRIGDSEFLLVRTGLDHADYVAPVERYAQALILNNPDRFRQLASFPIPLEGAEVVLYRCLK